jgi:predicted O-methyltransferase YrrM
MVGADKWATRASWQFGTQVGFPAPITRLCYSVAPMTNAIVSSAAAAKVRFTYLVRYRLLHSPRIFSQHSEDGILMSLINRIGIGPRRFAEFGFGPVQNNCLAFALTHKASGLFIDGSERNCRIARKMFRKLGRSDIEIKHAWIERETIDSLLGTGELDVLSIDVDGNDYWLWQAIHSVNPRIVVIEYNASFGPDRSVTVPYDPAFKRHRKHPSGFYHGMSLKAAVKLGSGKGFALVQCDDQGLNAFFVRRDLLCMPEVKPENAYCRHALRSKRTSQSQQERIVYSLPLVEV